MKNISLFFLLTLTSNIIFGQTAYIQVIGESGLSVFLNNQFKGKTSAEYNGIIIENVTAGKNLIKIVKEGFTPFEEYILVKPGEVFAYKVQPFTKHLVHVSETGNTGETDKKAAIITGNLVIQSIPIEIKITIPDIDGIDQLSKTMDKWAADSIPAGTYNITFTFNQKVINKTIEIIGNGTTNVFVNMISNDFSTNNSLDEKREKERLNNLKELKVSNFLDSIFNVYRFKPRMKKAEFLNYNLEANNMKNSNKCKINYYNGSTYSLFNKKNNKGPCYFSFDKNYEIVYYSYYLFDGQVLLAEEYFKNVTMLIESQIPKEFIRKGENSITIHYWKYNTTVTYQMSYDFESSLKIVFGVMDR